MGHKAPVNLKVEGDKVIQLANHEGRPFDALIVKGEKLIGLARLMGNRVVNTIALTSTAMVRRNAAGDWQEITQVGRKAVKSKLNVERIISLS